MEIRKTSLADLPTIIRIYSRAKEFMRESGNSNQWTGTYPEEQILLEDIDRGCSYVCVDSDRILGTFFFAIGDDPTYAAIYNGEWLNDDPYGTIHRIAVSEQGRGVATFCIDWALSGCGNLRIDTHEENRPMRNLLDKLGFTECGIIFLPNGDPRIAYQKTEH